MARNADPPGQADRRQHQRDAVDHREHAAEQRAHRQRRGQGDAGDDPGAERRRRPARRRDGQRDEAERAGPGVLRRVPERARQVVDRQPVEYQPGHRVDVVVAQRVERAARLPQPPREVAALGAGAQRDQRRAHRGDAGARQRGPREQEDDGEEEEPGAGGVDEEPGQRIVAEGARRRGGDGRRHLEVGPVVVQRPIGGVRIARRRGEAAQLGGQGECHTTSAVK